MLVERITPDQHYGPYYSSFVEHLSRYVFAARFLDTSATVLDLGCGCGYGSAYLIEAPGRTVLGVDIAAEATAYAGRQYRRKRLEFVRASAASLPIRGCSVQAVVALEMIEHVEDARAVLREMRRVMKPEGVLIVSTPNRIVTDSSGKPTNPYHIKEFTPEEFRILLRDLFGEITLYGQAPTPAGRAARESIAAMWQNLYLLKAFQQDLRDEIHALRARLDLDEGLIGLSLLRKLKRWIFGQRTTEPLDRLARWLAVDQQFLPVPTIVNSLADFDITPYSIEKAPVLLAVCRG